MSDLVIRKSKLMKQVRQEQKHKYLQKLREQMIKDMNNEIQQQSQNASQLRVLIRRSMMEDEILGDIRQNELLRKLRYNGRNTQKGRQIELMLVLLSNILLDKVSLNEKQEITDLSLELYHKRVFQEHLADRTQINLSCILSTIHLFQSLTEILGAVEEKLSVECQLLILGQSSNFIDELVSQIINPNEREESEIVQRIVSGLISVFRNMLYAESQYQEEIRTRFERNTSVFCKLLSIHSKIAYSEQLSWPARTLHTGMLQIQELLIKKMDISRYPLYFESEELLFISLHQIYINRNMERCQLALNIIIQMFRGKDNLFTVVEIIESWLKKVQPVAFFKRLLERDDLRHNRIELLELWVCEQTSFNLIKYFFDEYWRGVVDFSCELVHNQPERYDQTNNVLKLLINISLKVEPSGQVSIFYHYLQSNGGMNLLENTCSYLNEMQIDDQDDLAGKCFYLMSQMEKHEL